MKKQLLRGLLVSTLAAASVGGTTFAYAADEGTPKLDLTVKAQVTAGTCSVSVIGPEGVTNTIAFGNVYVSELGKDGKGKVIPFKLRFSDCVGLSDKKADVVLAPISGKGCAGGMMTLPQFPNMSDAADKAARTAVEVWTGTSPTGGGTQLDCYNKNKQTVDLSGASATNPIDFQLSALLTAVTGYDTINITAGDFLSQTTFTITYQ